MINSCLENGIEQESRFPKMVNEIINKINPNLKLERKEEFQNTNMRSSEEILKDYGL